MTFDGSRLAVSGSELALGETVSLQLHCSRRSPETHAGRALVLCVCIDRTVSAVGAVQQAGSSCARAQLRCAAGGP